jgi:hypothetical protein
LTGANEALMPDFEGDAAIAADLIDTVVPAMRGVADDEQLAEASADAESITFGHS